MNNILERIKEECDNNNISMYVGNAYTILNNTPDINYPCVIVQPLNTVYINNMLKTIYQFNLVDIINSNNNIIDILDETTALGIEVLNNTDSIEYDKLNYFEQQFQDHCGGVYGEIYSIERYETC